MEKHYVVTVPGQEVEVDDLNLVSENASLAVDRTLAELLRMGVDRGILPAGTMNGLGDGFAGGVLRPSGSANASVKVAVFRAVIGAAALGSSDPLEAIQGLRSAICDPSSGVGSDELQFAENPGTNDRIDLVYARVDVEIPDVPVTRYVKDTTDAVNPQSISVTTTTFVSLGVVQGVPAGPPLRPDLPSDSGSSYYILLGHVHIPAGFTLTSSVTAGAISEQFTALRVAPTEGVLNLRAAAINTRYDLSLEYLDPSVVRQVAALPTSMTGGQQILLALRFGASGSDATIAVGDNVVDDSVDWRNRIFKCTVVVANSVNPLPFSDRLGETDWTPSATYDPNTIPVVLVGQSIKTAGGKRPVAFIDNDRFPVILSPNRVTLYVDDVTGNLCATLDLALANVAIVIWVEATGYIPNSIP